MVLGFGKRKQNCFFFFFGIIKTEQNQKGEKTLFQKYTEKKNLEFKKFGIELENFLMNFF